MTAPRTGSIAMIEPFLLRAFAAGIGVAAVAGAMGCFVVWRRMAYFGDSLAHSALLGIALGLLVGIDTNVATLLVGALFATLLVWLQSKRVLATDTLLGILAHAALSIGMVTIGLLRQRVDLHAYLFGDILTVTPQELVWIYGGGALVMFALLARWQSLVLMTVHEDLARAEGVNTFHLHLMFMCVMTVVVAISLHIVGILLITSMLIIPAATARQFSRSPEAMALTAGLLGILAVCGGLYASMTFDTPSGPSIVATAAAMFSALLPLALYLQRRHLFK